MGKLLRARERATSPFVDPPTGSEARGTHWIRPDLVAEVAFTEWSADGALRHPSFKGLRSDKAAHLVVREEAEETMAGTPGKASRPSAKSRTAKASPSATPSSVAGIAITHADKAYFPEADVTKLALAQYYDAMAPTLLPYIAGRPLSLVRCPDGWNGQCFYQKNTPDHMDDAVVRIEVPTSKGPGVYMGAKSAKALVALVQWGVIEVHPWGGRVPRLDACDTLVFDFDPDDGVAWKALVEGVQVLRALLDEFKLTGFLKTTGGKGLHVVVPIRPGLPWPRAKEFAKAVAALLARTFPQRFTAALAKEKRKGKIFIDYLRNAEGATAVAPYSVRARKNAPVATPLAWQELSADVRFDHFNIHNVRERVRKGPDPWAAYFDTRQAITIAMAKKLGLAWSR
jgi:bifunctional non-homologous end joining protein LigD